MSDNTNPYSRLLWWSCENFMSIEKGKCEFDEKNIINIKGYNDSGKSAMLMGLKVLLCNSHPTKQVEFIQDGKDYFRILAQFDDGVMILRDKYINGQSLYEMYKDNQVIYTTKLDNGALSSVKGVPEPIAQYLGLITYEDTVLNARACFEKQIGVQTTGSENYKMFNTVLKSEEIASAATMLNNDKNKLVADINNLDNDISANKEIIRGKDGLTKEIIDFLKSADSRLDIDEDKEIHINEISSIINALETLEVYPEVKEIEGVDNILNIISLRDSLKNIIITPEIGTINTDGIDTLVMIKNVLSQLNSINITPEVNELSTSQLDSLIDILNIGKQITEVNNDIIKGNESLERVTKELTDLETEFKEQGVSYVKCPACGQLFDPSNEKNHTH